MKSTNSDIAVVELLPTTRKVIIVNHKDRDIAMVFQNYALYLHMTIYDNMAFGLKLRHYTKEDIDKRVKHAANILGLTEYLQKNLQNYLVVNVSVLLWDVRLCGMLQSS